jgi:hypothetical protein
MEGGIWEEKVCFVAIVIKLRSDRKEPSNFDSIKAHRQ